MALATKALDTSTWSDFARLAEEHRGVWDGCWCLNFHEEGRPSVHTPEQRRALKEARVREGRAHAALVFDDGRCVGWCQFGPTEELPRIKHQKAYRDGLRSCRIGGSHAFSSGGLIAIAASPTLRLLERWGKSPA